MIFRIHHERRGGHVHCRLFSGTHDGALGNCGSFIMRKAEFDHFAWLLRSRVQFVPDVGFIYYWNRRSKFYALARTLLGRDDQ